LSAGKRFLPHSSPTGKTDNRDSINTKVFEVEREGASRVDRFGEGEEKRGGSPLLQKISPPPSPFSSKTFDLIESLFPAFPEMGKLFLKRTPVEPQ